MKRLIQTAGLSIMLALMAGNSRATSVYVNNIGNYDGGFEVINTDTNEVAYENSFLPPEGEDQVDLPDGNYELLFWIPFSGYSTNNSWSDSGDWVYYDYTM